MCCASSMRTLVVSSDCNLTNFGVTKWAKIIRQATAELCANGNDNIFVSSSSSFHCIISMFR